MKQFLAKHKLTVGVILAGIVGIPSMTAYNLSLAQPEPVPVVQEVRSVAASDEAKTVTPPQETVVETPQPVQEVVTPVVEPVILSTQEYAEKYLNLTYHDSQGCLDRIIAAWPERFTPEVREANIKALRAWASVCATGMIEGRPVESTLINRFGENGAFFDSGVAATYRQLP